MPTDRVEGIAALLARTEEAHGAFETSELNGVYDEAWPRWYAAFAVDHGLAELLGHAVSADDVAAFLSAGYAAFEARPEATPDEPWAAYIARRMADEL